MLPATLADLPKSLPQFDSIEVLIVDDGSIDGTADVAKKAGVHHVVKLPFHQGLAAAFSEGLRASLALGADIVVHTDADNQYPGSEIQRLIEPILLGKAHVVIGCRNIESIPHFSSSKKRLQRYGSLVVRWFSNTNIPDVTSGFRAITREAALRLMVISDYTYTLETIIQAGLAGIPMTWIPIKTNPKTRTSRLIKSNFDYISRSILTILRIYTLYRPLRTFLAIGGILCTGGILLGLRFVYYYLTSGGQGHIQSLILAAIMMIIGFGSSLFGMVADLTAANRRILEELRYKLRKMERPDDINGPKS